MLSFRRFRQSFRDAGRGLCQVFKTEQNFRIQVIIAILAVIAMMYFPLRSWERILVIVLIMLVLTMELLNTALEYFADLLKPRLHHYVFIIKDIMAAAVMLTAVGAVVVGTIIFLPHFLNLLYRI